jgi:chemotaxis protein methyltransferase CheR
MEETLNIPEESFRRILSTVRTAGCIDLINYEPSILCHRFERFMQMQGYSSAEMLVERMVRDKSFADYFLEKIRVATTEMFRDPQMWKELMRDVFPKFKYESVVKIWVPEICGDDELNSLLILLDKAGLLQKSMVYATCVFENGLSDAKSYFSDLKKMEIGKENFRGVFGLTADLEEYFSKTDKSYVFGKLTEQVIFLKHDLISEAPPDMGFNLILFRNRALNYSAQARKSCIEKLHRCLLPGGYFIIGIGETLRGLEQTTKFVPCSKTENIFKKV